MTDITPGSAAAGPGDGYSAAMNAQNTERVQLARVIIRAAVTFCANDVDAREQFLAWLERDDENKLSAQERAEVVLALRIAATAGIAALPTTNGVGL